MKNLLTMRKIEMIEEHLKARGISHQGVLNAIEEIPRENFVPKKLRDIAYDDNPLPIGYGQTISQPYIVALMTQELNPKKTDKVLEVGTGSGYQAAVLSKLVKEVYTIEIIKELSEKAKKNLKNYKNVHVRHGNGFEGWKEKAPFDKIIVTAAPEEVPKELLKQLKDGGKIVIPIGDRYGTQILKAITKKGEEIEEETLGYVRFVPMRWS